MGVQFKLVKSTKDKAILYELRKKVFVEQEKRFNSKLDHIVDRYDSFEETLNIIAVANGMPIAAIRMTMDNPAGLPVDETWDFPSYKKTLTGRCVSCSWLCCLKEYRKVPGLITRLLKYVYEEAQKRGFQHIFAVMHPPVFRSFHKYFGIKSIGPEFISDKLKVPMIPVHVDLNNVSKDVKRKLN